MSGLETKDWIGVFDGGVVEHLHGSLGGLVEAGLVAFSDVDEGDAGGGLLVAHAAESGLVFDDHVWDALSLAKLWEPHDKLNGVNVVGDDDELGLTVLNQIGDVVETEPQVLLASPLGVASIGLLNESLSLVLSGLWSVVV